MKTRSLMCVGAVVALLARPMWAQTIEVTTLMDVADPPFDDVSVDPSGLACGIGLVSDLPGADGQVSLREAIIAANNAAGPQRITFAPELSGGTIHITFDDVDFDSFADPLPFLCAGGLTIDGDINGDNVPDITLDGSAIPVSGDGVDDGLLIISSNNTINGLAFEHFVSGAVGAVHISSYPVAQVANNTISHNTMRDAVASIFIIAGLTVGGGQRLPGFVTDTMIVGNTVADARSCSICLLAGDARTSGINGTTIADNTVMNGAESGIVLHANFPDGGAGATISNTSITGNTITGNAISGISAYAFVGRDNRITGLDIRQNTIRDNDSIGIALNSGVCGATNNVMEATIANNTLMGNGPVDSVSGIFAGGGGNFACDGSPPPAARNRLDVTIAENTIRDTLGSAITVLGGGSGSQRNTVVAAVTDHSIERSGNVALSVIGGIGNATTRADGNTVTVDLARNSLIDQAVGSVNVFGGISAADMNQVTTTLADNVISGGGRGMRLTGGLTIDDRPSTNNVVTAMLSGNGMCGTAEIGMLCGNEPGVGAGAAPDDDGNGVSATLTDNRLADLVVGTGCEVDTQSNRRCSCAGDCNGNGTVAIDELVTSVNILLERRPLTECLAADADVTSTVTVSDLVRSVNAALGSCPPVPADPLTLAQIS